MFKKIFIITSILLLIACDGSSLADSDNYDTEFGSYINSKELRIFAEDGVSESFLIEVGEAYELMLGDSDKIDQSMRSQYLSTTKDEYVFQRVGVLPDSFDNFSPPTPPSPYADNATDYIWELAGTDEADDQIGEVIEHLLHTVTTVILYLSYPVEWDYNDPASALSLAMQEAVDKGIYDISSYDELKNDQDYNKVLTQEYAYWLILAEWDYFITARKKMEGISGNEEFIIGTPSEIASQLPLGHSLYTDYVEKIISIPNVESILGLFPNN